jgi:hypothetical protein
MTHEQARTLPLTDLQRTRIDFARRDLEAARAADLGRLDAAGLILVVEKLRGRLHDVLTVVDEICDPPE